LRDIKKIPWGEEETLWLCGAVAEIEAVEVAVTRFIAHRKDVNAL